MGRDHESPTRGLGRVTPPPEGPNMILCISLEENQEQVQKDPSAAKKIKGSIRLFM